MRTHIETLILQQHDNLKENLNYRATRRISCCDLKEVNFAAGGNPDYTNPGQRSLYLLRYGPAYTVEYYKAYEAVLNSGHLQSNNISIASIGCGAFIDKASANYAVLDYNIRLRSSIGVVYNGIDIADWGEDVISDISHTFIHKGIQQLLPSDFSDPINILIFPKSLPEIPQTDLQLFLQNMNASCFQDRMCIISSVRNSGDDIVSSNSFCDNFCNTFHYRNISNDFDGLIQEFLDKTRQRPMKIDEVYNFNFCSIAKHDVNTIFEQCIYSSSNYIGCSDCNRTINRAAIEWSTNFCTIIYYLEKI